MCDTELEAKISGWHAEWKESISIAEVSIEKTMDVPEDLMHKYDHQLDDDSSTKTPTDPEM